MNKFQLRNEGELFTGCIRKYHSVHKRHQHEVAEEVRRQGREIYHKCRSGFFRRVLQIASVSAVVQSKATVVVAPPPGFEFMNVVDFVLQELEPKDNGPLPPIVQTNFALLNNLHHSAEFSDEDLEWAEDVSTSPDDTSVSGKYTRGWMVRKIARQLAAANYMATYSPWRETHNDVALFSFPWTVSDVIACGVADATTSEAMTSDDACL